MTEAQYAKWLDVVAIANEMPLAIAHRMRCAFDWAGAVWELPELSADELASAAASHVGARCFFD